MSSRPKPSESGRGRFIDWYFRDENGELVLGQSPNRSITIVYALGMTRTLVRWSGVRKGSPVDAILDRAMTLTLLWWAGDEVVRGTTPYRRTVGTVALLYAVLKLRRRARR